MKLHDNVKYNILMTIIMTDLNIQEMYSKLRLTNHDIPSDVRYVSKYRDTPGVSGYDTAMLVYRYFYEFNF